MADIFVFFGYCGATSSPLQPVSKWKLQHRLPVRGEAKHRVLHRVVNEEAERALSELNLATSQDMNAWDKRIEALGEKQEEFVR